MTIADNPSCPECEEDENYTVELVYSAGNQFEVGHSPWDEPGTSHRSVQPDTVHYYQCSNGHRWVEEG